MTETSKQYTDKQLRCNLRVPEAAVTGVVLDHHMRGKRELMSSEAVTVTLTVS